MKWNFSYVFYVFCRQYGSYGATLLFCSKQQQIFMINNILEGECGKEGHDLSMELVHQEDSAMFLKE